MAWIESHQELARHPKTRRLARALGVSVPAAIGHLHLLWWWALDYAEDGDLSSYSEDDLADAALWEGDPGQFLAGLIGAGFVEEDRHIHDWWEYAQRWIEKRRANAERMRAARAKPVPDTETPRAAHVQRTLHARAGATVPNLTVPNQDLTGPVPETEHERAAAAGAPPLPEALRGFDLILRRAPGYEPSAEFYEKVVERYRTVDLSEEALKLVGWLGEPPQRKKGRTANTATIFNWLKRATTDRPQEYRNGTHRNGTRSVDTVDALAKYDG